MKLFILTITLLLFQSLCKAQTDSSNIDTSQYIYGRGPITKQATPKKNLNDFIRKSLSKETRNKIIKEGIKGKVFITITVDSTGRIANVHLMKGIDPVIDSELLQIIQRTQWEPAIAGGKPVNVRYAVPISIGLSSNHRKNNH